MTNQCVRDGCHVWAANQRIRSPGRMLVARNRRPISVLELRGAREGWCKGALVGTEEWMAEPALLIPAP